jgi:hypothetical protein
MAYQVPQKFILSLDQLAVFQTSNTRQRIVSYLELLNDAVVGVKLTDECSQAEVFSFRTCELDFSPLTTSKLGYRRYIGRAE